MINTKLTKDIVKCTPCPVGYCRSKKGKYCKTPNGNMCEDLHKRRYGKYLRDLSTDLRNTHKLLALIVEENHNEH